MNTIFALDDGLTSGNLNAADIVWVIAAVLGLVAAILATTFPAPVSKWAAAAAYLAVGLVAFGLFLT